MTEASKAVAKPADAADTLERDLLAQAKTPQERVLAFQLASTARQHKMLRDVAVAVAETGWGKEVSPVGRAAVVRYCLEIGADPVNHVNVLGGNVYLNANFWRDLVASNKKFLRADTTFIHDDERASDEEREHRKALRVTHGVPEAAPGAAIVTLYYEGDRGPFLGVNWAGVRNNDPVGKQDPTKTAESRAYRRAAMKAEPAWFKDHPRLHAAQEILVAEHENAKLATVTSGGVVPLAEPERIAIAPVAEASAAAPKMVRHEPSAVCKLDGSHPENECGYHRAEVG